MEQKDNRYIAECPGCKWQISIYGVNLLSQCKIYCNRCRQIMLSPAKPSTNMTSSSSQVIPPPPVKTNAESSFDIFNNAPPEKVGEYRLIKMVGQGTVGEIFLGEQEQTKKIVAIKLLSQKMQKDNVAVERFLQEARVHSRLGHPNIVKIEDVGYCPSSKRLFLVMEYVEGESLENILNSRGAISQRHSLKIAMAVAYALEHALKQRIIHRDLKPGNILIDKRSRRVKVTDLGLGKILEEKGATLDGELMGTAYYMPPEQIRNAKEVDHRADIYALGATLYHMIAGRPPYGEYKGTLNILKAKIAQDPIPITEYVQPAETVVDLVNKAMARDREMRYKNPAAMQEDMQKTLEIIKSEKT